MASAAATYQQTYNSFSGVDMAVIANDALLAEIQGLSYTVTREKAPLYTMGSADPRSFSRGKRGIAGSMIFLVFDRSALLDSLKKNAYYLANSYEVSTEAGQTTVGGDQTQFVFEDDGTATQTTSSTVLRTAVRDTAFNGDITLGKTIARARYHDQILPFSVILTAANEYGHIARMVIHGVEIMNVGSGLSVDDITTDESSTFVATSIIPWHRQRYINPKTGEKIIPSPANQASAVDGL